jgi:tetratricopeptide (TPR) repeat protein
MTKQKIILMILAALLIMTLSHLSGFDNSVAMGDPATPDLTNIDPTELGDFPSAAAGIQIFQERVKHNSKDAVSLAILGQLYLRQARQTGDVTYYQQAEAVLHQALALLPNYVPANITLASTLYAQHNFSEALEIARRLYQDHPQNTEALAIMGDAYLALGKYQEAEDSFRELSQRQLTPPVLARLAHQAELHGQPEKALQLMQRAAGETLAAGQSREELVWYLIRLGDLYFNSGQLQPAGAHYEAALRLFDNQPIALAGLGKVRAAQGHSVEAIRLYEQAIAIIPQPDLLAALGDLYLLTGQPNQAQRHYDTVEYTGKLAEINRQLYNRQLATFYADHDRRLDKALALALAELELRQDIYGFDAAAWAYYKNGRFDDAQQMMEKAMALGTRDARLSYHAGMIAWAQADLASAKAWLEEALAINPYFDLRQAALARETLEKIEAN